MAPSRFLAVVDDDEQFRNYLRTFLEARGYSARCYTQGEQLLAAVRSGDAPAVVLLDVSMPGAGGLTTLRALRELQPDSQTIMLSGQGGAPVIVEALRLGAADYVMKPADPEGLGEIKLEAAIKQALERRQLQAQAVALRDEVQEDVEQTWWHTNGPMREVARMIERVADSDVTVLIRGESGVGKELVARAIHRRSARARGAMVKVNCAALPAELLESELFGHERGAFTGADTQRIGKFEHAHGGTIMLDEIGEMSARLQAKLLHVIQDGSFTRLGSNKPITVDARVIAATHRDIEEMIHEGQFREDLYYRLKVIEIVVPPLRDRPDELAALLSYFLAKYSRRYQRPLPPVPDELRALLLGHSWPGNVRELENCIKRFVLLQNPVLIERELRVARQAGPEAAAAAEHVETVVRAEIPLEVEEPAMAVSGPGGGGAPAPAAAAAPEAPRSLPDIAREAAERAERSEIERVLAAVRWNRRRAAEQLGVSYKTLLNKIRELRIDAE